MKNSFGTLATFTSGGRVFRLHRLETLEKAGYPVARLPFALKILLENLLRREDGLAVTSEQIEALARWEPRAQPSREIAFGPARVLLQDFTGVPAVVDLAAMREAISRMGGKPRKINPLLPAELVIDHSVQVDEYGKPTAFAFNAEREFDRNRERYAFLRWGQIAFDNFKVVPPDTGIVHQVNLEFLARVVMQSAAADGPPHAYPDTLVGTDSHTTMINGLGVLGWGVGGIEAEAAMLGQSVSMLIPQVVGFHLEGALREGSTATDLVLTVTQILRKAGVVGKFVEFFGPGLDALSLADRATIANMAPEYGATCGLFPVDGATLEYLALTGRDPGVIELVECYLKEQGMFRTGNAPEADYSDTLRLDLGSIEPSLAGPRRPQDRVRLGDVKSTFLQTLESLRLRGTMPPAGEANKTVSEARAADEGMIIAPVADVQTAAPPLDAAEKPLELHDGSVVIAAITSCTNTSNPAVMMAAGLVAKKAGERGLTPPPWVKTSLAPGSKAVTEYLARAGLMAPLERLGFHLVGYGCTTCIGNSGPLPAEVSAQIEGRALVTASVLSGNRNFEGRIHPEVRANYLASPPLVVAYALAGRIDLDLVTEPLGEDRAGKPVYLKDLWPRREEIDAAVLDAVHSDMFRKSYADVFTGDARWQSLQIPTGDTYAWDPTSTYVKEPPYFLDMPAAPPPTRNIIGARVLAVFGDSITTDHISPAGSIKPSTPAGLYLQAQGVAPGDFNSYGARRGNHEVMVRGTFANVRIRNLMVGTEGGRTLHLPDGEAMWIFDAAMKYCSEGVPLIVIAGKEYGSGSSRDWAAKGPLLLGVRAVIAESYERIHRSNLIGMGIAPLQFAPGSNVERLGLTGREVFDILELDHGIETSFRAGRDLPVRAIREDGGRVDFPVIARFDTPQEILYYKNGGILQFVLRQMLAV